MGIDLRDLDFDDPQECLGIEIGTVNGQPFIAVPPETLTQRHAATYSVQMRNARTGEVLQGPPIGSIRPIPGGFEFSAVPFVATRTITLGQMLLLHNGAVIPTQPLAEATVLVGDTLTLTWSLALENFEFRDQDLPEFIDFWIKYKKKRS